MKRFLLTYLLGIIATFSFGQKKTETFYDHNWEPCNEVSARFVSFVEKTNNIWRRTDYFLGNRNLQMVADFKDSLLKIHHGWARYFYANGTPSSSVYYVNNKKQGDELAYHSNGMMSDSAFYENGEVIGAKLSWHRNGMIADSSNRMNDSMQVYIAWFDNGVPATAGLYKYGKKSGKWRYFHHTGALAAEEYFEDDIRVNASFYKEDGNPDPNGFDGFIDAQYPGGKDGWSKFMNKNLYWPANIKFVNGNRAVVVLSATIDISGKVVDAEVDIPFHSSFDPIALKALQNSKNWEPARSHNRKVPFRIKQAVTFSQDD